MDQATAVFAVPVTFAVNCWVCPGPSDALAGVVTTLMDCDRAALALNNKKRQSAKVRAADSAMDFDTTLRSQTLAKCSAATSKQAHVIF